MLIFRTAFAATLFLVLLSNTNVRADIVYSQTLSGAALFTNPDPIVLTFTGTPAAASDATLTLVATSGELAAGFNKRLENLSIEGDTYTTPGVAGLTPGYILPTTQTQEFYTGSATALPDPILIPIADLNSYVLDGQVVVSVDDPPFIAAGNFQLTLSYTTAIPEPTGALIIAMALGVPLLRRRRAQI